MRNHRNQGVPRHQSLQERVKAGKGNKAETSGKVEKTATEKKVRVGACKPGRKSGCPIKGRGKPSGHVVCAEVDRTLEALGVDTKNASLCTKAAIMKGHIKITGELGDLEQEVNQHHGECGHMMVATLGDLLNQLRTAATMLLSPARFFIYHHLFARFKCWDLTGHWTTTMYLCNPKNVGVLMGAFNATTSSLIHFSFEVSFRRSATMGALMSQG